LTRLANLSGDEEDLLAGDSSSLSTNKIAGEGNRQRECREALQRRSVQWLIRQKLQV